MNHLLLGLIVLPLLGAALILMTDGQSEAGQRNIRWTALFATLAVVNLVAVAAVHSVLRAKPPDCELYKAWKLLWV